MLIKSGVTDTTVLSAKRRPKSSENKDTAVPGPGNNGGGAGGRLLDKVTSGIETLVYESTAVLQNDPALAVREFATRVHDGASRGYGSADLQAWAPYVGVGARTLIAGANILRAQTTLKDKSVSGLEKGLDVVRVATDLIGVAGAVMRVVSPEWAPLGTKMMGIAQSADLVSHGARFGFHAAPRVKEYLRLHEEKKAKKKASGEVE